MPKSMSGYAFVPTCEHQANVLTISADTTRKRVEPAETVHRLTVFYVSAYFFTDYAAID